MKFKACRLSFEGIRYQINADGSVDYIASGLRADESLAAQVRSEAKRLRRNRGQREHHQAMRDLGLVKTPYGWE